MLLSALLRFELRSSTRNNNICACATLRISTKKREVRSTVHVTRVVKGQHQAHAHVAPAYCIKISTPQFFPGLFALFIAALGMRSLSSLFSGGRAYLFVFRRSTS